MRPACRVTINQGLIMRAWYDVAGFGARDQDERGIRRAAAWIGELIAREVERGVPADRIVLVGFSQGGAMALFAGLRYPRRRWPGWFVCPAICCCRMRSRPRRPTPTAPCRSSRRTVRRIRWCRWRLGQGTRDGLEQAGYAVDYHEYPMPHSVCYEEVRDIGDWLADVLD